MVEEHTPETLRSINNKLKAICFRGLAMPIESGDDETNDLITPVDVTDDELKAELDALTMKRDKKIESIGYVLIEQDGKIVQIADEIKRLEAWMKRMKSRRRWLAWYCLMEMLHNGIRVVTGKFIELRVHKNSQPTVKVLAVNAKGKPNFEQIDPDFVEDVVKVAPKVNTDKAKAHFASTGRNPKGLEVRTNEHHLRIC